MSASQYAHDLERARKTRVEAERKAGEFRTQESKKRTDADKAEAAAAKSNSPTTQKSKLNERNRRLSEAQSAGKKAAEWQKKATTAARKEADLVTKLNKARADELNHAEKTREKEHQRALTALREQQLELSSRMAATEDSVSALARSFPVPKMEKLRILVLASDSAGGLRLGREQKRIRQAVQNAVHRDWVDFDFRPAATPEDLLDGLSEFQPHVVHFSGHSNEESILLEIDQDFPHDGRAISTQVLGRALESVDSPPSVVVLNSCKSASQLEYLVKTAVPFAVGMLDSIGDGDAIAFAARFYATIANGQSLASAVAAAQVGLEMVGLPDSDLPVLSHASDADPKTLHLVQAPLVIDLFRA